jgi:hypothetical protein
MQHDLAVPAPDILPPGERRQIVLGPAEAGRPRKAVLPQLTIVKAAVGALQDLPLVRKRQRNPHIGNAQFMGQPPNDQPNRPLFVQMAVRIQVCQSEALPAAAGNLRAYLVSQKTLLSAAEPQNSPKSDKRETPARARQPTALDAWSQRFAFGQIEMDSYVLAQAMPVHQFAGLLEAGHVRHDCRA